MSDLQAPLLRRAVQAAEVVIPDRQSIGTRTVEIIAEAVAQVVLQDTKEQLRSALRPFQAYARAQYVIDSLLAQFDQTAGREQ